MAFCSSGNQGDAVGEGGWPSRAAGPGMWQEVAKVGQIHTEGSSRDHPVPRGGFWHSHFYTFPAKQLN